ncbi:MAG TPA: diguanylate cyclase [Pseudomonadales bacterium]|nr:diguanylate cyclase [Pseudomonadales bacterium]
MRASNAVSRFFLSPLTRLSFGLVMLTLAVLFTSEFIGLVPDSKQSELQTRKVIAEMLALQLSMEVRSSKNESIQALLDATKKRNPQLLSVAVRRVSGDILASAGAHENQWTLSAADRSSPTQMQVALFDGKQRWGSVELRFAPLGQTVWQSNFRGSFGWLLIFMALSGFMAYRFFLKRALRELSPDSVIPDRVRNALDTLTEGLLLVDNNDTIMFANQAFAIKTGFTAEQLIGKESSSLDWQGACLESSNGLLPWLAAMQGQPVLQGVRLQLLTALKMTYTFHVNVSPITGGKDSDIRGALVTFDDITALEHKNFELQETLDKLQESKREIVDQNKTLLNMATRDPLTQSLNRRSLFESFDALFAEIRQEDGQMACIMVDIDHFKKVNDTYGHAVGDEAIKFLANTLSAIVRAGDLVGRMGGEEFVVVLPNIEQQAALTLAERMRKTIELSQNEAYPDMPKITSSFGVAMLGDETLTGKQLIDESDKALYVAKKSGRNRVVLWSEDLADQSIETASSATASHESGPNSEA